MYKKLALLLFISSSLYAGMQREVVGEECLSVPKHQAWFNEVESDQVLPEGLKYRMQAELVAEEEVQGCCGGIRLFFALLGSMGGDEYGNDYPMPGEAKVTREWAESKKNE